ncbi:MAG: class I SAM-dependent methyltransferase [Parvularculaceae bacterium]
MQTVTLNKLRLSPGDRLLDVGCGAGRHLHAALADAAEADCIGLDLNAESLAAARDGARSVFGEAALSRLSLIRGDARRLPFPDDAFDAVICSEALEHIVEYEDALAEIARVAKPEARLAISVPRGWPERICWTLSRGYREEPGGHVRIFDARMLQKAIEARGFQFEGRAFVHGLHSPYWWLRCLFWRTQDANIAIHLYRKFLEWDLMKRPRITRLLDAIASPLMGKSVVLYFRKGRAA